MGFRCGIVGLPNVGKSTLFNALTATQAAEAANYPFCTIEPNTGEVGVPDPRLEIISKIGKSARTVPTRLTFVDIAGLVKGASLGEGLGNRFLGNIRDVDAICHVVRAFETNRVVHVEDALDPRRDMEIVQTELAIADLETIEKRLPRLEKEARVDRGLQSQVDLLTELRDVVAAGEMVAKDSKLMSVSGEFADLHLLTAKPVIYVFNSDEWLLADPGRRRTLEQIVAPSQAIFLDCQIEAELIELEPDERVEMLAAVGQGEPGLNSVIRAAYETLGLQSYLTGGEQETRAWTIRTGATAPEAAGVIHTDFQRGFIAAEVVDYDRLIEAGSWPAARSAGRVRTEGRRYVMQANDVVEFRFNI